MIILPELMLPFIQNTWDELINKTGILSKITIGSSVSGTAVGAINNTQAAQVFMQTDLLSLLQYSAYAVSIIVGILTIMSWYRKNSKKNKNN